MERSIAEASKAGTAMEGVARAMESNTAHAESSVGMQRMYGQMQMRAYVSVLIGGRVIRTNTLYSRRALE